MSDYEPRVYVACLACYNAGKLHGEWLDADDGLSDAVADHFGADEDGKLACGGEELQVHDSEGFEPLNIGECGVDEAEEIGAALREHGTPLALVMDWLDCDARDAIRKIRDGIHLGTFKSLADYAEDRSEQMGDDIPQHIRFYVDWERYAEDCETNGEFYSVEHGGEFYIFDTSM